MRCKKDPCDIRSAIRRGDIRLGKGVRMLGEKEQAMFLIKETHDRLSEVIEDPRSTKDDLKKWATSMCIRLNDLYDCEEE